MDRAFTAFGLATVDHRLSIHRTLKSENEITMVLTEALGSLIPGFKAEYLRLVKNLKDLFLGNSNTLNQNEEHFCELLKKLDVDEFELQYKKALEIGGFVPFDVTDDPSDLLPGEIDVDDFLRSLNKEFQVRVQNITENFKDLTDEQLGILFVRFDAEIANQKSFKSVIEDLLRLYTEEVMPIGDKGGGWIRDRWVNRVVHIGDRLALVRMNLTALQNRPKRPIHPSEKRKATPYLTLDPHKMNMAQRYPFLAGNLPSTKSPMATYEDIRGRSRVANLRRSANKLIEAANKQIETVNAKIQSFAQRNLDRPPTMRPYGSSFTQGAGQHPTWDSSRLINRYGRSPIQKGNRPQIRYPMPVLNPSVFVKFGPASVSEFSLYPEMIVSKHPEIKAVNSMIKKANDSIKSANESIEKVDQAEMEAKYREDVKAWEKQLKEYNIGQFEKWISKEMKDLALSKASNEKVEITKVLVSQLEGVPD